MLNSDKTELLVLNAYHRPRPPLDSITVGRDVIHSSHAAKKIRVWFNTYIHTYFIEGIIRNKRHK